MDTGSIKGIIVPIVTPVDENNCINKEAMARMVNYVIKGGVHGILAFGSNGEFFAIDHEEQRKALACMIKTAAKRVPVYMGVAGITTRECIKTSKMAVEEGADGISILPPMFISPSEDELYTHIVSIAETAPELPVLLYNNPGKVGYGLSVKLVNRLADVPNIVGIKDTSGNMTLTAEFIRTTRDKGFKVMAGKDTMILGSLAYGAVGAIASTANIVPELVVEIYNKYMEGDIEGSCEAQFKLTPFRNTFDKVSFPAGTKDACNLIGLNIGNSIKPNTTALPEVLAEMEEILTDLGYIKK